MINSFGFFFSFAAKKLPIKEDGIYKNNQKKKRLNIFVISIAAFDFSIIKVTLIIE